MAVNNCFLIGGGSDFPIPSIPQVDTWLTEDATDGINLRLIGVDFTNIEDTEITIPTELKGKKITEISNNLFNENTNLVRKVVITQPVKIIYKSNVKFAGGIINEIIMNNLDFSLYGVNNYFNIGQAITKLTLVNGFTSNFLPNYCFNNCVVDLSNINFDKITRLGNYCFQGYQTGGNLTFNNVANIEGTETFKSCNIGELNMPNLTKITASNTFAKSTFKTLKLENLITFTTDSYDRLDCNTLYLTKAEIVTLQSSNAYDQFNLIKVIYLNHCSNLTLKNSYPTKIQIIYTNTNNVENLKQLVTTDGYPALVSKIQNDPRGDQN